MHLRKLGALALLSNILVSTAFAHELIVSADLNGVSELPPTPSPATGHAQAVLDLDLVTLHLHVEFEGLTGPVTAAHIDGLTAVPLEGEAGIAVMEPSLPDFPLGGTAGHYEATIDLTVASSYAPGFIAASGGTVSDALNALIFGMEAGRTYLRIRTQTFQDGEIRGFFALPEATPGDLNCDGTVNNFDIDPFVMALTDEHEYEHEFPGCNIESADVNHDHVINNFDIDPFVACLVAGGCPE